MLESKWGLRFLLNISDLFIFLLIMCLAIFLTMINLAQNSSKTIEDVPVEILYNTKNLHVTKSPDTVDVTISGPQSKLLKIESSDDIRVTVNLSNAKSGNYKEDYIVKGLVTILVIMLNLNTLISPWRIKILKQCMFSLIFHKTM